jgi:hypothetical protein
MGQVLLDFLSFETCLLGFLRKYRQLARQRLSRLQKLKTRYTSWETALNAKPGSELAALNDYEEVFT